MMDRIAPGGVDVDLDRDKRAALREMVATIRERFPRLVELYDNTASLQDRTVGAGRLSLELAERFGCGGVIGRASGRDFDARRDCAYSPYDELRFETPVQREGDVNARVWLRVREVEESLRLISQILDRLPVGPIFAQPQPATSPGEGWALIEGFRGDVFVHVRLGDDGRVARCHLRDPSWFQWPLLEAAIEGNIVADFPLCNKSFNCSYSGCDL
jgi:Ni,Fe-hydrogenase III large subunit